MKSSKNAMLVLSAISSLSVFADIAPAPVADAIKSSSSSASTTSVSMPSAGTSTTSVSADGAAAKKSPIIFKFNNYIYGGSVSKPLSSQQPDVVTGKENAGATAVESHIRTGVKLSSNLDLTLNPVFASQVSSAKSGSDNDPQFLKPIASYVRLGVGSFLKSGKLNWGGDFRAYAPVTDDLKSDAKISNKHIMYLRTGQNFSYDLNNKVTLGIQNIVRGYLRPSESRKGYNRFKLETIIGADYHVSDALDLSIGYDMLAANKYGKSVFDLAAPTATGTTTATYLELGLSYTASKMISLNPYIDMSTGEHVDEKNSRLGLNVFMSIL